MKILQKKLEYEGKDYYVMHLSIINSILPKKMTSKEIEILALFFNLDKVLTQDDMFNTLARRKVKEQMDGMTAGSLSNHLKSLIEKGFIDKNNITNRLTVKPYLIPEENKQGYQFKLIKK